MGRLKVLQIELLNSIVLIIWCEIKNIQENIKIEEYQTEGKCIKPD